MVGEDKLFKMHQATAFPGLGAAAQSTGTAAGGVTTAAASVVAAGAGLAGGSRMHWQRALAWYQAVCQ